MRRSPAIFPAISARCHLSGHDNCFSHAESDSLTTARVKEGDVHERDLSRCGRLATINHGMRRDASAECRDALSHRSRAIAQSACRTDCARA